MTDQTGNDNLSVDSFRKDQCEIITSNDRLPNGHDSNKLCKDEVSSKQRKLILHFDNRNTLQVSFVIY